MIEIRRMTIDDIKKVAQIEKDNFSIPWSEQAFADSLKLPESLFVVAENDGTIIGYCGMYISFKTASITNIAVDVDYRRKNVASMILNEHFKIAKEKGVTDVTLEVRQSNVAAISLYEKNGFKEMGIRKNFYDRPKEDALIMWKHNL